MFYLSGFDKLIHLSESWFPHKSNGDDNQSYVIGLFAEIKLNNCIDIAYCPVWHTSHVIGSYSYHYYCCMVPPVLK